MISKVTSILLGGYDWTKFNCIDIVLLKDVCPQLYRMYFYRDGISGIHRFIQSRTHTVSNYL